MEDLKPYAVVDVYRITIKRQDQTITTGTVILTFATPKVPEKVKAAYLSLEVRPYVPNPLRCYHCQKYGHGKNACKSQMACFRCSETGHDGTTCKKDLKCINCKGAHMASSKDCPIWNKEKQVQTIKHTKGCSFYEARKIVEQSTPPPRAVTYSQAVKPSMVSIGCQTVEPYPVIPEPEPEHSQSSSQTKKHEKAKGKKHQQTKDTESMNRALVQLNRTKHTNKHEDMETKAGNSSDEDMSITGTSPKKGSGKGGKRPPNSPVKPP